jgi:hypothetical protein
VTEKKNMIALKKQLTNYAQDQIQTADLYSVHCVYGGKVTGNKISHIITSTRQRFPVQVTHAGFFHLALVISNVSSKVQQELSVDNIARRVV